MARPSWHETPEILVCVFRHLSNRDLLICERVCRCWAALKAPLPDGVRLDLDSPEQRSWLEKNADRATLVVLEGDHGHLPRLIEAVALRELELRSCSVTDLPPCILGLGGSLRRLALVRCDNLRSLPDGLSRLTALEELVVERCPQLSELPPSIGALQALTRLVLDTSDNDNPEYQPYVLQPSNLRSLPDGLGQLRSLRHLTLRGCSALPAAALEPVARLPALLELRIAGCHGLDTLPQSLSGLSSLRRLEVVGVNALERLPELGGMRSLTWLEVGYAHRLAHIPESVGELRELRVLNIGCHGISSLLPESIGYLPQLESLLVDCAGLRALPASLGGLSRLTSLAVSHCLCLQELPDSLGRLRELRRLVVNTCVNVAELPASTSALGKLQELVVCSDSEEYALLPKLPECLGALAALTRLAVTSSALASGSVGVDVDGMLPPLPGSAGTLAGLSVLEFGRLHMCRPATAAAQQQQQQA